MISINDALIVRGNKDNGSLDVNIQDQYSPPFHRYFMTEDKTDITLTIAASQDDITLNVSAGHGFTATGEYIIINYGSYYQQSKVISVATNAITIDSPIGMDLPISSTQIIRGKIEMNVDGSVTPVTYYCRIGANATSIDIQHLHVFMQDNLEGDDSKYGGIGELTNGTFVRYENSVNQNLGVYKTNGDYIEFGGIQNYTQKAGGGEYSMDFAFDLKTTYGVVLRLVTSNYIIKIVIQDDLTGLTKHRVVATGQEVVN